MARLRAQVRPILDLPAAILRLRGTMDTLFQDVRFALRSFVKAPGFSALTLLCLALGLGVNGAIFSIVDTVAIRPLPFRDPDRLVSLGTTQRTNRDFVAGVSYLDGRDWRERTRSFETIAFQ